MPSAFCMIGIMVSFAIMTKKLPQARRQRKGIFLGCFGQGVIQFCRFPVQCG